ncbi:ester cyclase [Galbitalea soli]|uniref:Ester cyclase n=1 Tax=Galbitalea soli TaxID=1268042 RepID=A0A7C9TQR3_9MICO|nr:ester cyclase [Galbitalea soli]NEM91101.1 ester cyclase [Galbitalea soli]NYJ29789.1 putative SnoaL-like aldol condensation-catalyzing enzyme [Galbitalea soli]
MVRTDTPDRQQLIDLLHVFVRVTNGHDAQSLGLCIADQYRQHNPYAAQDLSGVIDYFVMMFTAFPDMHAELLDVMVDGDVISARCRVRGTHQADFLGFAATGRQFEIITVDYFRYRDGLFVEHWDVISVLELLVQLGVSPHESQQFLSTAKLNPSEEEEK